MCSYQPRSRFRLCPCTIKAQRSLLFAPEQSPDEENLRELGACIEILSPNIRVHLVDRREPEVLDGVDAVELGGLDDEARIGRPLKEWQQGHGEVELRNVVYLNVRVDVVVCETIWSNAEAGNADECIQALWVSDLALRLAWHRTTYVEL